MANTGGVVTFSKNLGDATVIVGGLDSEVLTLGRDSVTTFDNISGSTQAMSKQMAQTVPLVSSLASGMVGLASSAGRAINTMSSFLSILKNVSDPFFLKRLAGMLKILSFIWSSSS